MKDNPREEADGTYAGAHALTLVDAFAGKALDAAGTSLLTLQFDGGQGRKLNQYVASAPEAIGRLQSACEVALAMPQTSNPTPLN
jgi:hypothetical protein